MGDSTGELSLATIIEIKQSPIQYYIHLEDQDKRLDRWVPESALEKMQLIDKNNSKVPEKIKTRHSLR